MRWLRRQRLARLLGLLGWAGPSALATKILFKWIIGRENTRTFLYFPRRYGFHWFSGGYAFQSLPSGHMTLLATLTTVFVAFYPRGKYLTWPVITILAGALVVTNYHFLGDVLAGLLLGHWLGWVLVAISQRLAPLNKPKGAYQAVSSKSTNSGSKSE